MKVSIHQPQLRSSKSIIPTAHWANYFEIREGVVLERLVPVSWGKIIMENLVNSRCNCERDGLITDICYVKMIFVIT